MYLLALFTIVGLASATYRRDYYDNNKNYNDPTDVCIDVPTIDRSLQDISLSGPIYQLLVEDTEDNRNLDNACITVFPLPGDKDTYIFYTARKYCDKSYRITSSIATNTASGTISRASTYNAITQYIIDQECCDTFITYTCQLYGNEDSNLINKVVVTSGNYKPLPISCQQKIEERVTFYGLPSNLYRLPLKLEPYCVTQPVCVQSNPFYKKVAIYPGGR